MAEKSNVLVFPEGNNSGIDPTTLLAMNNGGFGGMNNPFWMIFMLPFLYPFFNMFGGGMWGNGAWANGFGGNNGGVGFLANQLNNDAGRDLILQAINGRADALGQLAQILNTSVTNVQNGINSINTSLVTMDGNNKLTGAQIINAIQAGNTALGQQVAQCCCENRLAICQQTNALQSQAAQNAADVRLQLAQNEAADQLSVCQQTNTITRQADGNTNTIVKAIADQNAMIVKEFCDLKERELQNKINAQGDMITQLRNQISNDKQTLQFNAAFHALDDKIDAIAAKQPNTVPVTWPNLTAVNNTPYAGGYPYYGNGFGGGIVF
jgi:hypothetical protein